MKNKKILFSSLCRTFSGPALIGPSRPVRVPYGYLRPPPPTPFCLVHVGRGYFDLLQPITALLPRRPYLKGYGALGESTQINPLGKIPAKYRPIPAKRQSLTSAWSSIRQVIDIVF